MKDLRIRKVETCILTDSDPKQSHVLKVRTYILYSDKDIKSNFEKLNSLKLLELCGPVCITSVFSTCLKCPRFKSKKGPCGVVRALSSDSLCSVVGLDPAQSTCTNTIVNPDAMRLQEIF